MAHNFGELLNVSYRSRVLRGTAYLEELKYGWCDAHVRFDFGSRKIDFRRWLGW